MRKGTVSLNSSVKNSSVKYSSTRVISFVGDMQNNIKEIIRNLNCQCGCKFGQFQQILTIFSDKISKVRAERDIYKQKYFSQVQELTRQVQMLEVDVQKWQSEAKLHQSNQLYMNANNHNYDSFNDLLKENSPNDSTEFETNLMSDIKNEQRQNSNLESLITKYNITWHELQNIIGEYVQEQESQFDNEEEKKLFKLGKKLEKEIWIKKVKSDVETIVNARKGIF